MKCYSIFVLAALMMACKPAAQAIPAMAPPDGPSSSMETKLRAETSVSEVGAQSRHRGLSQEYINCKDQAQGAIESAECISVEQDRQDSRLNANYRELLGLLDGDRKTNLVQAQREWLVLKEKDGAFEASLFENSQMENLAAAEREMLYICERANRIEDWVELSSAD